MRLFWSVVAVLVCSVRGVAAPIRVDVSGVTSGPVSVAVDDGLRVGWSDGKGQRWLAVFALDSAKPLITEIAVDGKAVVTGARPYYRVTTGKRSGGWDAFFDLPAGNAAGTRTFVGEFHPVWVDVKTVGNRVEVVFDGMRAGIFSGSLRYTFYPGTALIEQAAVMHTDEADTAYFYDAGLEMTAKADERPGGNMGSKIAYFDLTGKMTEFTPPYGSERRSLAGHYRTIAAKMGAGSIAVFPPPHRYFFARDYTTNQGYLWYSTWRGRVGLGVHQYPDDDTSIDPWMNAPVGTEQEMQLFLLPSAGDSRVALKDVQAYTHGDRFPHVDGFVTFAPHWHLAYTVQEMAKGIGWEPEFKTAMRGIGIDAAMIMDFHGDGHPEASTDVRLKELEEYYKATRARSGKDYLLIPSEEANVYLGGHWVVAFSHPVYWFETRKAGEPFVVEDPHYGKVYRVGDAGELWKMIKAEGGFVYETHPRTKGSTGYPEKILGTDYFRDASYFGVGWKQMPSDLSSPRLGERGFKTLDDLNNLGLRKKMMGEVDVFQLSAEDELYAHMNVNYLRLAGVPSFDRDGEVFDAVRKGDGFITTGEILLPSVTIAAAGPGSVKVEARVSSTFPLRMAEVVWGDGKVTRRKVVELGAAGAFEDRAYAWTVDTPGWTWARFAVWDVAGDGAFTNPVWK